MRPLQEDFVENLPDIRQWLSSVPVIVAVVIVAVDRAKIWLATTPLNVVPLWVIATVTAMVLTVVGWELGTLHGDLTNLLFDAVTLAAAGSGFREWWKNGLTKPLSASGAAAQILSR
jgi:hypothetical protein